MENLDPTTTIWQILWPVIIGGILGIAGSTLGPLASAWWSERSSRQKLRIQRFEEMLAAVHAFEHWAERRQAHLAYGENEVTDISPLHRGIAVASLWFPDLLQPLRKIEQAFALYALWMHGAALKRLNNEIASINDGHQAAYTPYKQALDAFHIAAADYAAERRGAV